MQSIYSKTYHWDRTHCVRRGMGQTPHKAMTDWVDSLLTWYHLAKREMPWRDHPGPYAVWISEIMLQQTQVNTVRGYFQRFLQAFPTVADLAQAETEPLLKAWEGLGYYTRVRNLRKAAQRIMTHHAGQIPRTSQTLLTLPGIGAYTAAAISSICFGEAEPVVDGNVIRVFARYLNLQDDFRKPTHRSFLADWLRPYCASTGDPSTFNQAIMELGALVCTPRTPQCVICPLAKTCYAKTNSAQQTLPYRPPKKVVPERHTTALILRDTAGQLYLVQHTGEKLLGGFWELPTLDQSPITGLTSKHVGRLTHIFTHFKLHIEVYTTDPIAPCPSKAEACWCADIATLPVATAYRKILSRTW